MAEVITRPRLCPLCFGDRSLAAFIAEATEVIAAIIGPTLGGLLNATFGNLTEMVVSVVALRAGLVEVVKASI
ncbi:MAG UNVERIFIED_CONTAM: hypothetical protein LVR29_09585 [Microcystis novacekii LVE1205-3]